MKRGPAEIGRTSDRPSIQAAPLTPQGISVASQHLAKRDRHLAQILKQHGPPPLWGRSQTFPTLVRIILEQQVSLASAASVFARLSRSIVPFTPERFIALGEEYLRSLGVTRQKSAYCLTLARSLSDRSLSLRSLSRMSDDDARTLLMSHKGIGTWSADIYLLMALRRPDIWPSGDVALVTAVTQLKQLTTRPDADELLRIAESWRPYRAVAARMLWQYYLAERNRL